MRLSIDHRTTYRFSRPQARLVQLLRLTPRDTDSQTIVSWRVDVDCDARLRTTQDAFGNSVTMLYAPGPLDAIELAVRGEVLTAETPGVLQGAHDPLPPAVFLRSTAATAPDAALQAFVARTAVGEDWLRDLHRLNGALNERFAVRAEPGHATMDVAATFAETHASPRELAQLMVA